MVVRREDKHDRRVKRISLADAGNALIERLSKAQQEPLRAFAELLTDRERTDLYHALAPILARPEFQPHKEREGVGNE
jgi:DNA-binding MarR family transcriptional regulator